MKHIEFEYKCHVRTTDVETIRALLAQRAITSWDIQKFDTYYRFANGVDVRLRATGAGEYVITYKDKTLVDGLEQNTEYECAISDGTTITELFKRIGATILVMKEKHGTGYRLEIVRGSDIYTIIAEIVEVPPLGFFLEVEYLLSMDMSSVCDDTAQRIREVLFEVIAYCNLTKKDIEPLLYIDMLRNQAQR